MYILFLLFAILSFSVGWCIGVLKKPKAKAVKKITLVDNDLTTQKEFENFLNYDGSMQE